MLPVIFVFFTALTLDDDGNGALASSPFSPYPLQPTYEYSHTGQLLYRPLRANRSSNYDARPEPRGIKRRAD